MTVIPIKVKRLGPTRNGVTRNLARRVSFDRLLDAPSRRPRIVGQPAPLVRVKKTSQICHIFHTVEMQPIPAQKSVHVAWMKFRMPHERQGRAILKYTANLFPTAEAPW